MGAIVAEAQWPEPADAPTLRDAMAMAIDQASWYDDRGNKHQPNAERRRAAIKKHGIEWLFRHGGFYRDGGDAEKDSGEAFYFERLTRRLYAVEYEGPFKVWLGWASGLDAIGNDFRELIVACKEVAFHDPRSVKVTPSLFWDFRDGRIYISNGDGEMARIDDAGVAIVENGTDGVLFSMGRTCAPWRLLPESEGVPLHSLPLIGGISTPGNPLAPLLLLLWILALPRNLANKPPLSLSGEIGSGKSRTARAIYEIFGMVPRISNPDKNDKGLDEFWVSVEYGGVSTFDNVDSKIRWLPDAVDGASTGAVRERRTLYTNKGLTFLRARSAVILTSSNANYASDPGLADRLVNILFDRPENAVGRRDNAFSDEIAAARDGLMTWLCFTLSLALRVKETPPPAANKRHPDWSDWCWRCGVALGYRDETEAVLGRAEEDKAEIAIKSDEFVGAVLYRMMGELGESWEGTAAQLREFLLKGGGPDAGVRAGTYLAFPEKSAAPEEYSDRAKADLTVRHIGQFIKRSRAALKDVFGFGPVLSDDVNKVDEKGNRKPKMLHGYAVWRFNPPRPPKSPGVSGVSQGPFLTFIQKSFSYLKVKKTDFDTPHTPEGGSGATPEIETVTDPENAPFL